MLKGIIRASVETASGIRCCTFAPAAAGVGFSMLPALRCRSAREPILRALSQSGQRRFTGAHGWPDLGLTMKPPLSIVPLQFDGKDYKAVCGCEVRYDRVPSCDPGWKLPK